MVYSRRCVIIVQGTLVGIVKMGLGICITTTKDVQGEQLKTSSNKSWCKNKIKKNSKASLSPYYFD